MGFVKAFSGALAGSLGDQWRDFLTVPNGLSATVGLCPAAQNTSNRGRSSNRKGSGGIITDGSLVVVPEGYALITLENGSVTGFVSDPGGYRWESHAEYSQSFFADDRPGDALLRQTWERFKFGGEPGALQTALYVNMKEIPNNRFGMQNAIYWDDAYIGAQVGATARGSYTLRIEDPLLFLKGFVPARYYMGGGDTFDFSDFGNDAATQLFTEVVSSLAPAFSAYANRSDGKNRMASIQRDSLGFAQTLSDAVERGYHWRRDRGIGIVNATLAAVDYDEPTKELMSKVQQADALLGARGNSNLQASFAEGLRAAGLSSDAGALGMAFMGMGVQGVSGAMGAMQQPVSSRRGLAEEDPYERLAKLKKLLDQGVIEQCDFDAAKKELLGI